ncbi:MAG: HlyD family efflux transporter periplasmic adaptor subunit [Shewanella sp.]|nr:HlyD family efflux transporter periplasmic adaptor subunit [Shewanella sp.]MCF1431092.1 HlyD family efflux transporter periplasmic adaptor subunit [Shewanella sp.]MCF1439496.1 HlyD family efflux transporter periplasmic adaptor subunit [Shewanella sp.]MCF1458941.1 HlyD family efflux transporter periplasmic adaptor subunit [Shewanella sp.]
MKSIWMILPLCLLFSCSQPPPPEALGTLERDRVLLRATTDEIITELPVREGSMVKQGDLLLRFDTRKQTAVVAMADADVAKARAYLLRLTNGERPEDIAAAQANVARARATLTEAELNFRRINQLRKDNLASPAESDKARAVRDQAEAELESSSEQLSKLIAGVREEDINQARATLDSTLAKLALEQKILDDLSVRATRDGRLDSLPFNVGERVPLGSVIVAIQADDAPYARVYVPEPYVAHLQIGQQLPVHVDGMAHNYTGTLRWISAQSAFTPYYALNEQDRSRLVYLAELDLDDSAVTLPTGIPTQVSLPAGVQP